MLSWYRFTLQPEEVLRLPDYWGSALRVGSATPSAGSPVPPARARQFLPYFIVAFRELGVKGLGQARDRFVLQRIEVFDPMTRMPHIVYCDADRTIRSVETQLSLAACRQRASEWHEPVTVQFLTPTRLKYDGRLTAHPEFHFLLRALLRRLSSLALFHCGERLDLLIRTETGCFPVDFKDTEAPPRSNHTLQFAGYALLIEEHFDVRVTTGFVYKISKKDVTAIDLSEEIKDEVVSLLISIRVMVRRERLPEPTPVRSRYQDCEYQNYCADIW